MPTHRLKHNKQDARDIGRRLAQFRKDHNVTQVELANHLGVTQGTVSLYERGILRVPSDLLVEIAAFLKTSLDALVGLKSVEEFRPIRDRRFARRLEAIDQLPKRDRDALLRTINAFLLSKAA